MTDKAAAAATATRGFLSRPISVRARCPDLGDLFLASWSATALEMGRAASPASIVFEAGLVGGADDLGR
jgi:hypothetical protein